MSDASLLASRFRAPTQESPAARFALIAVAFAGVALLIFAPLVAVFVEALAKGAVEAVASLGNRDALSAIRLTLTVAAIAVLLVWRHKENIQRLLQGKESRLGSKKKA